MVIPKPFMYDQNKILSQNVSMTLSPTQSPNTYALFVTADLSWLGDPARAYPIVIDPNFTTAHISSFWPGDINNDTYIHDTPPYNYFYNNTYMTTGHDATLGSTRALVKFNLPTLPTGALVVGGTFSLNKTNNNVSNSAEVDVSRITSSWDPTAVNWSNKPSIDNNDTLTKTSKVNVGATTTGYINFDVGSIVKSWYNGNNVTNYGLEIVNNPETNTYFTWSSSDSVTNPPLLSITYMSDLLGINPKWSYANTPSGSVNTVNGNFLSSVTDFSWPGRGIPINVTRTYNSRATYTNFLFGPKWASNLDMQLQVNSWGVVFIDAAGSEHTFFPNSDGTTYTSQDNYPVQLYKSGTTYIVQESYTAPGTTTLTTGYQTQLPCAKFNANGLLTELDDGKGNATTLTHNGTTSIVVSDPSGRTLTLALSGGKVDHLTTSAEPTKNKVTYVYTNGNLTGVTYDNASSPSTAVQYDWTNGFISAFTDKGGAKTYLTYDANNRLMSTGSQNLLSNPSFEAAASSQSVDNWTSNIVQDSGSIQQTATSTPPLASNGFHSLNLHSNTLTGTSGDSYLYATQIIPVQPNHTYTLSGLIKTIQPVGSNNTDPNVWKAFLNVEQLNSSGSEKYQWVDTRTNGITGTTDWTARNLSVSTFADTAYLKVLVEVQHDSAHFGGDAYFDSIQLEDNTNMLSRNQSDIETDASGWSANTGSTISRDTTQAWQGSASLKETVTSDSYAITPVKALTLPDQNNPSVTYTVSGYVNIPTPLASGGGAYLRVIQRGADNSVVNDSLSTLTQNLNSTTGWQRISGSFTLAYPTTTKTVELLLEASNAGTVYWDGLQLEKNSTPSSFLPGWLEAFQGHTDFRYFTDNGYQACTVTQPAGEETEFINNGYGTPKSIIQDPNGKRAETDFVWDASDNLHQLTTPKGNIYTYTYDDVGNMIDAQDPNGKHESATYYYNETQTITNALNKTIKNVWDPKNLNNNNTTDVNGNSQAFAYDDSGNMTSESNLMGIADNRVLNSDLESPVAPATPTFTRSSAAYKQDGTQVAANAPRYESGKYNQAVTIEEGTTNLLNSQGGGASTDWSKWSHWGNRSYWSSESQTTDPNYGKVYAGVNANSLSTVPQTGSVIRPL